MRHASQISARAVHVNGTFPPALVSATIASDGVTLTAVFSQAITSADITAGFSLTADGGAIAIASGGVVGPTATFVIAEVLADQVCVLSYDAGPGDVAGTPLALASFTRSVTNNSTQTPGVACAYPLDLAEAALQSSGFTGRLIMSNASQTGDYLINDFGPTEQYAAAPQVGVTLPATSGKKAVRWRIDQFTASSSGVMRAQITFYDATATSDLYHIEYYTFTGGVFQIYVVQGNSTTVHTGATTGSPASNIDFAWNGDTGVLRVFVDGTEATLSNGGTFTPQALFPLLLAVHGSGAYGQTSPGHIKSSLLTNAADMAGATWLSGYTDFCGTAIT